MAKTVELFYDFSSPNGYFAAMLLPDIAARQGATIGWRPIFLGGLFKSLGVHMTPGMSSPQKAAHSKRDFERWSERHGVPFRFPTRFPINTVRALRTALALDRRGFVHQHYAQAVFRAYWVDDQDIGDAAVLSEVVTSLGLDAAPLLAEAEDPQIKDELKRATDEAAERGVFGVPSMIVGDELYFGKDRLDFVEAALERLSD